MNARYLGRKVEKNEFGDVLQIFFPCVEVNMEKTEVDRFQKMMQWISENFCDYEYDLYGDEAVYTAHVQVQDGLDGAEFLSSYKDAKKTVR